MIKSRSLVVMKQKGFMEFIKYKKNKIYTKYEKRFNINIFTPYLLKFCKPLNDDYKFIVLMYGASGHWALETFLSYCGIDGFKLFEDNYCFYKNFKTFNKKDYYLEIVLFNRKKPTYKSINRILDENKPLLILTRDPISRLKTNINHGGRIPENCFEGDGLKNFHLYDKNIKDNLDRIRYMDKNGHIKSKNPDLFSLYFLIDDMGFNYFSNTNLLKNKSVFYIDTKELSEENAFSTIKKLSKQFNFNEPNENIKHKFEQKVWNEFIYFLPYRLVIKDKILLIISDENRVFLDGEEYDQIRSNLIDIKVNLINNQHKLFKKISINMQKQDWKNIKNDEKLINELKQYLEEFLIILDEKVNERKCNQIKEDDVLDFFKEHKDVRNKLKNILDYELQHIKQTRPDIIDSWNYYKKFEALFK
ncbi:DUF2972 domain-containing protein [Campylobacter insulaenigrae]|uniref:DUF2972 domain-containing protein n=1 Tax=Campylobacter insulaenigrae TaxID=260714 RepID=UPI0021526ACD|nr:DUF2972 domain-containing protein [Campylobacter insulaenigrae]MCR6584244.1 DUF2972 domain-containing protein [Campylobacter insulaenigrae]